MRTLVASARAAVVNHGDHVRCVLSAELPAGGTAAILDRLLRLEGRRIRAGALGPFRVLCEARDLRPAPPDMLPTIVRRQAEFCGRVTAFVGFKGGVEAVLRALEATRHSPNVRFFEDRDEALAWLRAR